MDVRDKIKAETEYYLQRLFPRVLEIVYDNNWDLVITAEVLDECAEGLGDRFLEWEENR